MTKADKRTTKRKLFRPRLSSVSVAGKEGPGVDEARRATSPAVFAVEEVLRERSNSSFSFAKDAMQGALRSVSHSNPLELPWQENARQALLECIEVGEHPIAPMLLSEGRSIFLISLQLQANSSPAEMIDEAAGWINTIKTDILVYKSSNLVPVIHKKKVVLDVPVPVVIVATYCSSKLDKSEVRRRTKLLTDHFKKDVTEVMPLCTSSGNGLGKLLRRLCCLAADAHGSERQSTFQERLLSERIRLLRETKAQRQEAAVMKWDEFKVLANECGLVGEKDIESAAAFLASNGSILSYRQLDCRPVTFLNTDPTHEWIFLDESLLRKAMDQVLQNAAIINWVPLMNRQHLSMFWGDIDEELHPVLLILFEHFGFLSPIMRTHQAAHEQDVCYVVPTAVLRLGQKQASAQEAIKHFTARSFLVGSRPVPLIGRVVRFKSMQPAIFGRVLAELAGSLDATIASMSMVTGGCVLISAVSPEKANSNPAQPEKKKSPLTSRPFSGCFAETRPEGGALILFDSAENCLMVFAWQLAGALRCHVLALVNRALSEERFADSHEKTLVTCIHCINSGREVLDSSVFDLNELNNLAAQGATYAPCTRGARCGVRIDIIAPDVVLQVKESMKVEYSDLEIFEKVGSGAFGVVHRGRRKKERDEVAVKMIQLEEGDDQTEKFAEFRHEVQLMADLQHPSLVSLLGICRSPLCLVTDFCPEGDLSSFLQERSKSGKRLSVSYISRILLDIATGIAFLHSSTPPVLHLDLKSPNILLMQRPGGVQEDGADAEGNLCVADPSKPVAKVADFGLSNSSFFPKMERMVDNPLWLAPEVMQKKPYSTPSDVYGFGIIANELFSLTVPFSDFNEQFSYRLENRIVAGERPTIPDWCPVPYKSLIERCWAHDPSDRPSIADVVAQLKALGHAGEAGYLSPAAGIHATQRIAGSVGDVNGTSSDEGLPESGNVTAYSTEDENDAYVEELFDLFSGTRTSDGDMPSIPRASPVQPQPINRSLADTIDTSQDLVGDTLAREPKWTLEMVLNSSTERLDTVTVSAGFESATEERKEEKKDRKKEKKEKKVNRDKDKKDKKNKKDKKEKKEKKESKLKRAKRRHSTKSWKKEMKDHLIAEKHDKIEASEDGMKKETKHREEQEKGELALELRQRMMSESDSDSWVSPRRERSLSARNPSQTKNFIGSSSKRSGASHDAFPSALHAVNMGAMSAREPTRGPSTSIVVGGRASSVGTLAGPMSARRLKRTAEASAKVRALEEKAKALAETARRLEEEALELERIAQEELAKEEELLERKDAGQPLTAKEESSESLPDLEQV